jgi:hypothetical protein
LIGGLGLDEKDTYGQYDITGHPVPSQIDGIEYRLKAWDQRTPDEPPRTLIVTISGTALATRFAQDSDPQEVAWREGLARIHGLLDLGLFDASDEYRWTVEFDKETLQPPLELGTLDFGDDSEQEPIYHVLSALRRARRELPGGYDLKSLDPSGACAILGIDHTQFDYLAGRLAERRWIRVRGYGGSRSHGDFYITEAGIQALERMERVLVKPKWQTRQASGEVQMLVPQVVKLIREWTPKQRYVTEEAYQSALAEYLVGCGISAPEQQGASLTDILAAQGIGVEIKLTPNRSEYDRLIGQIVRQVEEFGVVVVLIIRPDRQDLLDEYVSRFAGDDRVIFIPKG